MENKGRRAYYSDKLYNVIMNTINVKIQTYRIIGGLRDCIKLFLQETKEQILTLEVLEKYNFEEKDLYDMKLTKSKIRDFKINKILKLCQ